MPKKSKEPQPPQTEPVAGPTSPPPARPVVHLSVSPWLMTGVVTVLTALAFAVGWFLPHPHAEVTAPKPETEKRVTESHVTPWGKLEYTRMYIEPPLAFIDEMETGEHPRQWLFRAASREDLLRQFRDIGLTEPQIATLMASGQTERPDPVFSPSDDFVLGLGPQVRARLYLRLGLDDRNTDQANVFRFNGTTIEDWLAPARMPQAVVERIKALAYRNDPYWMFADLPLVLPLLKTTEERGRLLRVLATQPTWVVNLHIDRTSNIETLANYWGNGGRVQLVRPFLEAFANIPGGGEISLSMLLPSFAETHLYTYPQPSQNPIERNRDCHWASLNFFAEKPDDRFAANTAEAVAEIQNNYYPVRADFQFGDLVVFMVMGSAGGGGSIFHSAIHIADDLVFTKNGRQASVPYIFMRMSEMKAYYPQMDKVTVMHFRRKSQPAAG